MPSAMIDTQDNVSNIDSTYSLLPIQAATFNYDTVYKMAEATGVEVRAKNNDAIARNDYSFHFGLSCWLVF